MADANNHFASQGKRKKSSRTPQGPRKVRDFSYTLHLASTKSNSSNIAGTPRNYIRLSLLQPRELGHRQTRQEAGPW
jgi:hypothetical protein